MAPTEMEFGVAAGIRTLFESSTHSDLQIHCRNTVFRVHKCILSCQGGFFDAVTQKGFKEDDSGLIELHEDEPSLILALLKFMYGIAYSVPDGEDAAQFYARLYSTADFYQLPLLKKSAQNNFENVTEQGPGAKGALQSFNAAAAVYNGTPETDRGLRDILIDATNKHILEVIDKDEGNQRILKDLPELAHDLVRIRASTSTKDHEVHCTYACPSCESIFGSGKGGNGRNLQPQISCPFCDDCWDIDKFRQHFKSKFPGP